MTGRVRVAKCGCRPRSQAQNVDGLDRVRSVVTAATNPSVLVSYSHDSLEHEQRVLEFCNRLRARGVDAFLDQFLQGLPAKAGPLDGAPDRTARLHADGVYGGLPATLHGGRSGGVGLGVVWEARILRNLLYDDAGRHGRIVPILLETGASAFVRPFFAATFMTSATSAASRASFVTCYVSRVPGPPNSAR